MSDTWEPILAGEVADRAWSVLGDLSRSLAAHDGTPVDLALFWSYAASALGDEVTDRRRHAALERFADAIERGFPGPRLFGGLAGAGWVAAHVCDDSDELLALIDRSLLAVLDVDVWTAEYDLIGGLVGIAVYFLERRGAPAASLGLERCVHHLAASCEPAAGGVTWRTRPELLPAHQRAVSPGGHYNCGVAHGVAGVAAALARIAERADAPPAAVRLRDDALAWLAGQALDTGELPYWVGEAPASGARIAWCYGAAGAGTALHGCGGALGGAGAWMHAPLSASGVVDASLCHGAAGVGHMCNRLYQATREPTCREAAREWFERALAYHRPGRGVGGFATRVGDEWRASAHFLDGSAGIGLALLAALTPLEPGWDRLLLCDLPIAPSPPGCEA